MPRPVPGMTEAEVSEQIRECFAMAGYARKQCTEPEAKDTFAELIRITQWQRERLK